MVTGHQSYSSVQQKPLSCPTAMRLSERRDLTRFEGTCAAEILQRRALCLSRSRACICMEYTAKPEKRHRLQFHCSLCLPPRMEPYRIMSTLTALFPQHRRLACHNSLTQAGTEGKGEESKRKGESAGSVRGTLSPERGAEFIPSAVTTVVTQSTSVYFPNHGPHLAVCTRNGSLTVYLHFIFLV